MLIQQASYGPERGGHAFLGGSDGSMLQTFKGLAWVTDLPSTVPANVEWKPYLRTLTTESHCVLVHTRPDDSASRAGMVSSRAAFIPLSSIHELGDLAPLVDLLKLPVIDAQNLEPLVLQSSSVENGATACQEVSSLVAGIANALVAGSKVPLVHLGQEGFDDAMLDLWRRLPPELRPQLSFGLSFGPQDTFERNMLVVSTPASLRARWADFQVVNDETAKVELTVAASAMLNVSLGRGLREFASGLGYPLSSFRALGLVEQAHRAVTTGSSIEERINAVRLVASLAKSREQGAEVKAEALGRLISHANEITIAAARSLRNLDLSSFANSAQLWERLEQWAEGLSGAGLGIVSPMAHLIADAVSGNAVPDWCRAILSGLRQTLSNPSSSTTLLSAMWEACGLAEKHVAQVLALLGTAADAERTFCSVAPATVGAPLVDVIANAAAERGLWMLCGTVLAIRYPPAAAVAQLFSLSVTPKDATAVRAALRKATTATKVAIALQRDDARVTQVAGEACIEDRKLLATFDVHEPVWFDILEVALRQDPDAIHSLPSGPELVGALVNQEPSEQGRERIWQGIAKTPLGNLVGLKDRAAAWAVIPPQPRTAIMRQTAKAWLSRFVQGLEEASSLEPELAQAVRAYAKDSRFVVSTMKKNSTAAVRFVVEVQGGSDWDMQGFLDQLAREIPPGSLSAFDAESLGRAIQHRNWRTSASTALRLARTREDFVPVIRECKDLLGFVERISLAWEVNLQSTVSTDELWHLLESKAAELYPLGPTDGEIWSRAGGANEDLPTEGSGKARWHRCLKEVRSGKGVGPRQLLERMHEDFPHNKALEWMLRQHLQ